MTGLILESQGKKFSPPGAEPVRLTNDGKVGPRGIPTPDENQVKELDPARRSYFQSLKPSWR